MESLCKACSEGRPHDGHDQNLKEPVAWQRQRRVGFAAVDLESLDAILKAWAAKPGRKVAEMKCTLVAVRLKSEGR